MFSIEETTSSMGINLGSVPPQFLESIILILLDTGAYLDGSCLLNKDINGHPPAANICPIPESFAIPKVSLLAKAITKIGPLSPLFRARLSHSGSRASGT